MGSSSSPLRELSSTDLNFLNDDVDGECEGSLGSLHLDSSGLESILDDFTADPHLLLTNPDQLLDCKNSNNHHHHHDRRIIPLKSNNNHNTSSHSSGNNTNSNTNNTTAEGVTIALPDSTTSPISLSPPSSSISISGTTSNNNGNGQGE